MKYITYQELPELFQGAADLFAEKKEELCEMDAKMGDGDLGLTMQKGFGALPQLLREHAEEGNIGKTLVKAGMKMAGLVPSTMGTLMASGIIAGGKALAGKETMGPGELSDFLTAFADGVRHRGKCEPGDCTILDAADSAAKKALQAVKVGGGLNEVTLAAVAGAKAGVEATKEMIPKYGKAAIFAAKASGVPDQGAVAGYYFLEGLSRYIIG